MNLVTEARKMVNQPLKLIEIILTKHQEAILEVCADLQSENNSLKLEIAELKKDRNAFLAKELEAVATWSADGIYRYVHQLTDDQFCQKWVRGQCTGDAGGVCCDNSPVPDWSEHGFVEEKR